MPRITLTRKLNEGIYRDSQEAFNGTVQTFPATKRGILKAARVYGETRQRDIDAWGNIGAGRLTLALAGKDVTEDVLLTGALHETGCSIDTAVRELAGHAA